jgi:glycerophosphoryl diester phosphodiesterase
MPHRRRSILALAAVVAVAAGVYLLNASWLAARPTGRPVLVAQRGVHQVFDPRGVNNDTCTATRIPPPTHDLIDNTLPSIAAAFKAGANVVEADVRETRDRQFVLFHDLNLDCRTNGRGPVASHTLAELEGLDVGFGYSADGGQTHPLRGKGVGQMTALEKALHAFPDRRFLIQFKDGDSSAADDMVRYLEARGLANWSRLSFFGRQAPVRRLAVLRPQAHTWTDRGTFGCAAGYLAVGWTGYVPKPCRRAVIIVPTNLRGLMWGWPNRFLERMRRNDVHVLMIGDMTRLPSADFSRLDSVDELHELPAGFDGAIWTDHIERIGPAAQSRWPAS